MSYRWLFITLLVIACSPLSASSEVGVREYAALRSKHSARVSLAGVRSDVPAWVGRVIEIRGKVVGLSGRADGATVIISTTSDGSFIIDTETPIGNNPGAELACLVTVGERSVHSLSDLRMLAFTYDSDLRRLEEAWQKDAEAQAARAKAKQEDAARAAQAAASAKPTKPANPPVGSVSVEELTRVYKNAIKSFNKKLTDQQADTIARSILSFSSTYKLDPRLVCAVILAESNFRIEATSGAGAQGLGQLMPGTAAGLGVDNAYDPVQNIYGSARYIRSMLERVAGKTDWNSLTWHDLSLALAAYNAGPGAVKKHGGIPPYRETQAYVKKVTEIYKKLCGQ